MERGGLSLAGTVASLLQQDDPERRTWAVERILEGDEPGQICLLDDKVEGVGLTGDQWTTAEWPAALAVSNPDAADLVLDVKLECHAEPAELPITAVVDDGKERREIRFKERGLRTVTLDPIPTGDERLVIITTDQTWTPDSETDNRQLGVRVEVEE